MNEPQVPEMPFVTEYLSVSERDGSITISTNYAGSGITVSEPPVYSPTLNIFFRCSPNVPYFPVFGVLAPCNLVARSKLHEECNASIFMVK